MAGTDTAPRTSDVMTDTEAVQRTREYYFAILEGRYVYHIAHNGETVCGLSLAKQSSRWFKRGSENVIPPEMDLCRDCDSAFHRELVLSKAHIREELANLAGTERQQTGSFSKRELAELLAGFRGALSREPSHDRR